MLVPLFLTTLVLASVSGQCTPSISHTPSAKLAPGYGAYSWACNLKTPRTIITVPTGEVLVLEKGASQVTCLYDDNGNGFSDPSERVVILQQTGINHGLVLDSNYIYASSSTTVWRWALNGTNIRSKLSNPQTVVTGIPDGGHSSRTLLIGDDGTLYVTVGSGSNIDSDPSRSLIRSFDSTNVPTGGYVWTSGPIFVIGLRNEVGIRFDSQGGMWGVENGCDGLTRNGVDIHNDNPGEEVNYFGIPGNVTNGRFYGYPYCVSTYNLPPFPAKTQLAHPSFPTFNDSWCQDLTNVAPPAYVLPAHVAPLDLIFYPDGATGFPGVNSGDMFVASHGSWNRAPPQGYNLYRITMNNGVATNHTQFFAYDSSNATGADWPHRPVGLAWGTCQKKMCLLLSSDASGQIFSILPTSDVTWTTLPSSIPSTSASDSAGVVASSLSICFILVLTLVISIF